MSDTRATPCATCSLGVPLSTSHSYVICSWKAENTPAWFTSQLTRVARFRATVEWTSDGPGIECAAHNPR